MKKGKKKSKGDSMRIKFVHSVLILFLVMFFISCEENYRTLGGYKDGYECIHNEDCGIDWTCDNGVCNKVCAKDMQDNNNDGICKASCSSDDLRCYNNHEISHCDDSSGKAVLTCVCKAGFQDNDNNGICEESCNNISITHGCDTNKVVDTCDDSSGTVVTTCKCRDDYQDNDNDDICKPGCNLVICENSTCNDSSGETTCICNDGFIDINDGAGCIERMVDITPTENFYMGCNTVDTDENYDSECDSDESPYHLVSLSPYKMDIYEVTVGEYKKCVNLGYCKTENFNSSWNYGHDRELHPMNGVSYIGAKEYCEYLGLRLPTEAEWEYAARGVDGRIYPWGSDSLSCEYATYNNGSNGCGNGTTSRVGSKPLGVSPNGVHDMVGNVWEWVSDYYQEDYYTSELMIDPIGPETGTQRVVHGGGWDDEALSIRSSNRYGNDPNAKNIDTGFRCAQTIE